MKSDIVAELPVPGSGCGDIRIVVEGNNIVVEYEYRREGVDWIGSILFENFVAFRFRDELHSVGYCSESYDAVARIDKDDSEWLSDLIQKEPSNKRGLEGENHYAVFLSNNGYFEIVAERFTLPASQKGLLN